MLLPLWRTSETYMALRLAHMEYERAHQLARVRNNDGGDHHITRPRKIGLAWQQLRASASILIDWILAAERNGWFGTPSRNHRKVVTRTAGEAVDRLHRMREARGLHHTGERYPGHGRKRPKVAGTGPLRTGPPDDDPPSAEPSNDPPFLADLTRPGDEPLGSSALNTPIDDEGRPTGRPFRVLLQAQLACGGDVCHQ